ncbi:MAG: bifunctional 5,10-methylene-tetrahydrofolate dehydrogenase/5,10-methylene-tetrahydrofolate cyclohydrolase [Actinobacteria bacterium]|nr:bifunctional 5,10-methylene-tetrahydrofolate dehydrogenase/5,10-methylene-tetrahydrofolate cyclohydrolase [Actinomycetota bacterium]
MVTEVIDGRAYAKDLQATVTDEVSQLVARGVRPGLATVLVGDDDAALVYERRLRRVAAELGCDYVGEALPGDASEADTVALVERLNAEPRVSGVLVLRPLPAHVSDTVVQRTLYPAKDVECVHPTNAGMLMMGRARYVPSTPAAAFALLDHYLAASGRDPAEFYSRSNLVVVGRSDNVGRPLMLLGLARDATVVSCDVHSYRAGHLYQHTLRADVVLVAAGVPGLVTAEHIRPGTIVVDLGINVVRDEPAGRARLVGDVDFAGVRAKAEAVTPVPGGVGPVTDLCLLRNVASAASQRLQNSSGLARMTS